MICLACGFPTILGLAFGLLLGMFLLEGDDSCRAMGAFISFVGVIGAEGGVGCLGADKEGFLI